MNSVLLAVILIAGAYLLGSIPFGMVIVRLATGKDIRSIESGRTGGTNAMRAAGFWAGLGTAVLDLLKGTVMVWVAKSLLPELPWVHVLAPLAAVLGHNYSIFLIERNEKGKLRLRGGAGGATTVGGALGLWAPSIGIIIPLGLAALFGVGYASLATMSVGLTATIIFGYRAFLGLSPWQYTFYGIFTLAALIWALRPNIKRLANGTERLVGWRAKKQQRYSSSSNSSSS